MSLIFCSYNNDLSFFIIHFTYSLDIENKWQEQNESQKVWGHTLHGNQESSWSNTNSWYNLSLSVFFYN